jgi:hypothetical protein
MPTVAHLVSECNLIVNITALKESANTPSPEPGRIEPASSHSVYLRSTINLMSVFRCLRLYNEFIKVLGRM